MDEQTLIAELIRWVMGIPADRVTWHHVALVLGGLMVWVLPAAMRIYHFVHHMRFIRSANPEQLAAYTGKLPPPKPPSLGGPAVMLLLFCLLGLTGRGNSAQAGELAAIASPSAPIPAKNCCKDCDPPSRCVKCHCEAKGKQAPPRPQHQRDERLTTTRPPHPIESSAESYPALYEPRWRRYLPES